MFVIIVILNYLHHPVKDLEEYKTHFHGRIIPSKENEPLPHINICKILNIRIFYGSGLT